MSDYAHLLDEPVDCDGEEGILIGCDPEIGITIVDIVDPKKFLLCITGPGSHKWSADFEDSVSKEGYRRQFEIIIGMLERGYFDLHELISMYREFEPNRIPSEVMRCSDIPPSAETCPFGQ